MSNIKTSVADIESCIKNCQNVREMLNRLLRDILNHTAIENTQGNQIKEIKRIIFAAGAEIANKAKDIENLEQGLKTLKGLAEKI